MVGQNQNGIVLQNMVAKDRVPSALIFSGPSGTGKTSAARILANSLDADPIEVDAASHGGVADVRALLENLRYIVSSAHRMIILDEAHSLTRDAFNTLLPDLEEPPPGVHFVLATTEPEKIPDPVLTRCIEFEFRRIGPGVITDRLEQIALAEGIDVDPEVLVQIANDSDGSMRSGLMLLDQAWIADVSTLDKYLELVGYTDSAPRLIEAMLSGDHSKIFGEIHQQLAYTSSPSAITAQIVGCFVDLLTLRAKGTIHASGAAYEARRQLALRIETERIVAAMTRLWELRTRIRASEDPRGNLELTATLISDVLTRGKQPQTIDRGHPAREAQSPIAPVDVQPEPIRKLTLAELQRMALKGN